MSTICSAGFSNVFATSRDQSIETYLVKNYVDRRDAIAVALRRHDIDVKFGSWKPVTVAEKKAKAAINLTTLRLVEDDCNDSPIYTGLMRGHLSGYYSAAGKPFSIKGKGGTGGGEQSLYKKGVSGGSKDKSVKPTGFSKKSAGRRIKGLGRTLPVRCVTRHSGVGVGYFGNHAMPAYKADCRKAAIRAGAGITFCYVESWMTQQFVETDEQRQASRDWAAMRKNYKALRRVDNRNAFTATVTVVKQATQFKSVGAAAYNTTSAKLHAAVADNQIVKNKVNNGVTTSVFDQVQGTTMQQLINIIAEAGGIRLCDIKLNNQAGTVAASFGVVNQSGKAASILYPRHGLMKADDRATVKDWMTYVAYNEGKVASQQSGNFVYDEKDKGDLSPFGFPSMRDSAPRMFDDGQVSDVYTSVVYHTAHIPTLDMAKKKEYKLNRLSVNAHFLLDTGDRPKFASAMNPENDELERRGYVRDFVMNGSSMSQEMLQHYFPEGSFTCYMGMTEAMSSNIGLMYEGKPSGRHLFIAVANVTDGEYWPGITERADGQNRYYCNAMTFFYLPWSVAKLLYSGVCSFKKFNHLNTGNFPLFPQAEALKVMNPAKVTLGLGVDNTLRANWLNSRKGLSNPYHDYEQVAGYTFNEAIVNKTVIASAVEAKTIKADGITAPAGITTAVAMTVEQIASLQGCIYPELAACQAGLEAKAFGKLKTPSNVEVARLAMAKTEEIAAYIGIGTASDYNQSFKLTAARLLGYFMAATEVKANELDIKSYKWTIKHLEELVSIYQKSVFTRAMSDKSAAKDYIQLKEVTGRGHQLWIAGKPTFEFFDDIVVITDTQQAIHHTVELAIKDNAVTYEVANSLGNFMEIFLRVIIRLIGGNVDSYLNTSLRENILKGINNLPTVKLSSHRWNEQNGASEHLLRTTFQVVIKREYAFLGAKGFDKTPAGAKSIGNEFKEATVLNKVWAMGQLKEMDLVDMSTAVMVELSREHALDHHFTKKTYHTGDLGYIDIDLMRRCCPVLFKRMTSWLAGHVTNIGTAAGMVMVLTLKAEKGLKRMTLGKAQSATPVKPSSAGFWFHGQKRMMEGCLVPVMLAPTLVGAAGMAFWIGLQSNLPAVYVKKANKEQSGIEFKLGEDGHPFDMTAGCEAVGNAVWTNTFDEYDQWNHLTPNQEVMIEGRNVNLFSILTDDENARIASMIVHKKPTNGQLLEIKWRVETTVDRKYSNLKIEYTLQWVENNGKLRSITKCQLAIVDESFVRNEFNPSLNNVVADMVLPQDTIKADPLYSYICLFANAVYHNIRKLGVNGNATIKRLASIKAQTNEYLGVKDPKWEAPLYIDNTALIAGVYDPFLQACEEVFSHNKGIWFDWCDDLVQCRVIWEYYTDKVAKGLGWVSVANPIDAFPELSKLEVPAGSRLVVYCESGDITEKTNILAMVVNGNNVCTRYMQRCAVLCGNSEVTLYNVELYESSTVKESVSNSRMLLPEIKCLDLILDNAKGLGLQKQLLAEGEADMMRTKYLAAAACGHTFSDKLIKVEFKPNEAGDYMPTLEVYNQMKAALEKAGLFTMYDLQAKDNTNFAQFCAAMKDFVFVLPKYEDNGYEEDFYPNEFYGDDSSDNEGFYGEEEDDSTRYASKSKVYTVWMPALLSFSKLSNNSDSNQDFVSKFFKQIFKPLFLTFKINLIDSKLCFAVMKSLLESRETIKLMGGGKNLSAKRVALGDVGLAEVHISYDSTDKSPNTAWAMAKSAGINVNASLKGEDVYLLATRAPLAGSYIAKLVIRRTVHIYDTEGNYVRSEQYIDKKKCRYFLPTVQVGTDVALPVITDGGDWDGDLGRWCALLGLTAEDMKAAGLDTFEGIWNAYMNTRNTALSKPMLAGDNDSYLADHFGIKRYVGNANKTMFSGMAKAIGSQDKEGNYKIFIPAEKHASNNIAATLTQNKAVGVAYAVYILGMFLSELFKSIEQTGKVNPETMSLAQRALCGPNAKTLVLLVAEVYEVMLGGFSPAADAYRTRLLDKTVSGVSSALTKEFIDEVGEVLKGLGAKSDRAEEVAAVIQLTARYYAGQFKPAQAKTETHEGTDFLTSEDHWVCLAACIFEMSRGKFEGFKGIARVGKEKHRFMLRMALELLNFLNDMSHLDDIFKDLVNDNFTLFAVNQMMQTLYFEFTQTEDSYKSINWSPNHLDFFCNFGGDNDGDDSNDDDNTPEPDSDPSDGGDAVEVVATEVVEAEPSAEATVTESVDVESTEPTGAVEVTTESEATTIVVEPVVTKEVERPILKEKPAAPIVATTEEVIVNSDIVALEAYRALYGDVTFTQAIEAINQLSNNKVDSESKNTEDDELKLIVPTQEESLDKDTTQVDLLDNIVDTSDDLDGDDYQDDDLDDDLDDGGAIDNTDSDPDFDDDDGGMEMSDDTESETTEPPAAAMDLPSSVTATNNNSSTMKVLNIHHGDSVFGEYIGRPGKGKAGSPLANPYVVGKQGTRQECYDKYNTWLWNKVQANDSVVLDELARLHKAQKDLVCFCAPQACHGDIIIQCLQWMESTNHPALKEQETIDLPSSVTAVETAEVEVKPAASKFTQQDIDAITELSKPLNDEQYAVLSSVLGGKNLFLTGEGGTGKSFTVSIIRAIYDYLKAPYIIVGSTGTSVVNIDGHATFNGMFGIGGGFKKQKDQNGNILPRTLQQWEQLRNDCIGSKRFNSKLKAAKQLENRCQLPLLAIVDEVSMVESALLSAVEAGLRKLNVKHNWLLVGDVAQFEPVEGQKFFCDDTLYCNRTKQKVAVKSIYNDPEMGFTGFNLKTNVRAKGDTVWAKAMSWVRLQMGTDYPAIVKERWEHSVNNKAPKNALHLAPTNKTVKRFNDEATAKLQAAGAYSKDYFGKFTTSKQIVGLPTDYWLYGSKTDREEGNTIFAPIGFKMTYCVGMRVMLRETNIYDDKGQLLVNNGAQGTVKDLTDLAVTVKFDNGLTRTLKAIDMVDPYERGIFTQIPLAPAYALTFNKAQGMTFDFDVIFHMYVETKAGKIMPIFANNAVYVALSRLTSSKHCWFVTDVVSDKGETAYTMFKKAFKASKEAVDFIYDLK